MNFRKFQGAIPTALAAIMVAAFATAAQAGAPAWVVDQNTGCQIWDTNPQPNESISWSGACVNGAAQGKGVVQWPSGQRYEGEVREGKLDGHGTEIDANGQRYEGEFVAGAKTALVNLAAPTCP